MIEWMTGAGGIWILMQGGSARIIWCSHNSCQPSILLLPFSLLSLRDTVPKWDVRKLKQCPLWLREVWTLLRYYVTRYWRIWRWKIGQMDANLATVRSTFGKSDSICQNLKVSNNFAEIFTLSEWYGCRGSTTAPCSIYLLTSSQSSEMQ